MSNPIDNIKPQENLLDTRVWRHTVGRISCALRLPVYVASLAVRVTAVAVECLITAVTFNQLRRIDFFKTRCCTLNHCKKDFLVSVIKAHHIAQSVLGVICAPAKGYHSFNEALKIAMPRAIQGKEPENTTEQDDFPLITSLKRYWEGSPQSIRMIIQSKPICSVFTQNIKKDTNIPRPC